MKHIIFTLIFLIASTSLLAQQDDELYFQSQQEIDSFRINYPDLIVVEGNVTIYDDSHDISSIDSLIGIKRITGDLLIVTYYDLFNLSGLDSLTFVGGDLILDDGVINDISALHNLDTVMGNFETHSLSLNYEGINSLTYIGEALLIYNNGKPSYTGFESLQHIGALNIWQTGLSNLSFIENIEIDSPTGNSYIHLFKNYNLSVCSFPNICEKLKNKSFPSLIFNNADGCDTKFEIIDGCY